MTTHETQYCQHCGIRYIFQASGEYAPEYNDAIYCPDCKRFVIDALSSVPQRAEMVFVPSSDFTEDEFKTRLKNELGFKRVWPGLYDFETNDAMHIVGLYIDGKLYRGTWWEKKGDFILEVQKYKEF